MPTKRTDPGQLRHRLVIERRQTGQDALGQPAESWETVATIWAAQLPTSAAGELVLAGRPIEKDLRYYRVRTQDACLIEPGNEIAKDGYRFSILSIQPAIDAGSARWADILCHALESYGHH